MIWVALIVLACMFIAALFQLASRGRAAIDRVRAENAELKHQVAELTAAGQRAREERKKINDRAALRTKVINDNRDGVQVAKDRTASLRTETNERLAATTSIANQLRRSSRQHGQALTAARIDVQKIKDRLAADEPRQGAVSAEKEPSIPVSNALRSTPEVTRALARLDEVARFTTPDVEVVQQIPPVVDLTKLLPNNGDPKVAVVVTCYNDEPYLTECLRSVQQQTLVEFECIIVDDASTDTSVAIAKDFVADDPRFMFIAHGKNQGPSAARNTGLKRVKAPFVAFLDSDDLLLRDNLEHRLHTLLQQTDPAVAGVFSGIEHRSSEIQLADLPASLPWAGKHQQDLLESRGECPFNLHAPLLRTDLARRTGGFDESMRVGAEDWEFWLRLLRNGYIFVPCKMTLGIYRQKPQSMVRAQPAGHLDASAELLESLQHEAKPVWRMPSAPFFFERPIREYEDKLMLLDRGYQYLALAALTQSDEQFSQALGTLPVGLDGLRPVRSSRSRQILAGLRRGLGLNPENFAQVLPEATLVLDNLVIHTQQRNQHPAIVTAPTKKPDAEPVELFYWQAAEGGRGSGNFGDELSPLLVSFASGRPVERAPLERCKIVALGSILDLVLDAEHCHPAIWGSGFIRAGERTGAGLDIHAVRGKLTNRRCGSIGAIGDPALLSRFLGIEATGEHRVGLLPHYVDWELPFVQRCHDEIDGVVVINPLDPPEKVLAAIAGCDVLFSSSLHGLICADSLNTPNSWIELSNNVVGDGYKFADYYSCFDLAIEPLRPKAPSDLVVHVDDLRAAHKRPNIDQLCVDLLDSFPRHI